MLVALPYAWAIMHSMLRLERLKSAIEALSQEAQIRHQRAEAELAHVVEWLETAPPPAVLREQGRRSPAPDVEIALPPLETPLATKTLIRETPPRETVIIGIDGSQIAPDRHAIALYYVIQVGALIYRYNGQAPIPAQEPELHFAAAELYDEYGLLISRQLGIRRAIAEMRYAVTLAETLSAEGPPLPVLALMDGPLLWPYERRKEEDEQALSTYLTTLSRLRELGTMPVGFTERPAGRGLIELLWQSRLDEQGKPRVKGEQPPQVVDDALLMQHVLAPGERSVWLRRVSAMNERHAHAGHEIWFCYLNLGEAGAPVIARIETPRWAAERERWTTTLHTVLVHQAQLLHGNPYVLARAHELALVTHQDKTALESLLHRRLLARGIPARHSEKARQKGFF